MRLHYPLLSLAFLAVALVLPSSEVEASGSGKAARAWKSLSTGVNKASQKLRSVGNHWVAGRKRREVRKTLRRDVREAKSAVAQLKEIKGSARLNSSAMKDAEGAMRKINRLTRTVAVATKMEEGGVRKFRTLSGRRRTSVAHKYIEQARAQFRKIKQKQLPGRVATLASRVKRLSKLSRGSRLLSDEGTHPILALQAEFEAIRHDIKHYGLKPGWQGVRLWRAEKTLAREYRKLLQRDVDYLLGVLKELDRDVGAGRDGREALVNRLEDAAPLVLETLPDSLADNKLVLSKRHTRRLAEAQQLAKRIAGELKTAVPNFENLDEKMTAGGH